jgi:hypothetical protein
MKTKRIKATYVKTSCALLDEWLLPADADSYERIVEQMADIIAVELTTAFMRGQLGASVVTDDREDYETARAALRAIGITQPRQKKGTQ